MSVTKGMSHDPVLHHPGEVKGPFHLASANINPMDLVLCGLFPPHLMGTVCNHHINRTATANETREPRGCHWNLWGGDTSDVYSVFQSLFSPSPPPLDFFLSLSTSHLLIKSELMPLAYGLACTFSQRLISNNFNNWSDLNSQRPGKRVLW